MEDVSVQISLEVLVAAIVAQAGGELRVDAESFNGLTDDLVLTIDPDHQADQVVLRLIREADLNASAAA
jgi:hypothetical protein